MLHIFRKRSCLFHCAQFVRICNQVVENSVTSSEIIGPPSVGSQELFIQHVSTCNPDFTKALLKTLSCPLSKSVWHSRTRTGRKVFQHWKHHILDKCLTGSDILKLNLVGLFHVKIYSLTVEAENLLLVALEEI